jgi:putative aldouronate transport system permease protein
MPTQTAAVAKKPKRALRGKPQKPFFERLALDFKRNWILYLMALPALIYFIVYCYAPMAGLYIAVSDFKISGGLFDGKFVGLKYLMDFFHSYYFGRLLRNTLVLSLETLIFGFPIPILFALVLNEIRSRGFKKLAQTVTYMPHFISIVVICGLVVNFFSLNGLVNTIVQLFGGKPIAFMSDPKWFRTVYVGSEIWQNFGWDSVVFLAALAGIDLAQFEAAKLDGASRWQTIWHISLPSILPTVVLTARMARRDGVG